MPLTGLDIYKQLPKTNCGDCGVPTCLAFAMKLAAKQASLEQCPHVTAEAKAALEGASAPPIRLVTIGVGEKKLELGNETVLFRHDETFYHPTGVAVRVDASLPEAELAARVEQINRLSFVRVGQTIGVNLIALQDRGDPARFAAAAELAASKSDLPLILMSEDPAAMAGALEKVADRKPLLYAATGANWQEMAALAKQHGCPLAVRGERLENLAQLSEQAAGAGAADLVLDSGARQEQQVLADQTCIRRAALRRRFRPFGYPTITFTSASASAKAASAAAAGNDPGREIVQAGGYVAKYGGIVVLDGADPWQLLPLLTFRQNIYTDPQKPIQLEAGLYQVNSPEASSPVLVTTNFSLTYFTVEGDVEASKVPSWIVVVDTEGTSVLTAWAAEKFTADTIAAAIQKTGVAEKVKHRKVIIPGYVAVLSGKLEDASGWEVLVGPRESSGIPKFLKGSWSSIVSEETNARRNRTAAT